MVNAIEQPGTDEADWRAWAGLGRLPRADLSGWARVLVLAAHPDDEVLGVGGTMAQLAAAGTRLRLVSVTDGEASHPGHPDPAALAARRAAETAGALAVLGAQGTEVIRLGFPDTGVAAREDDLAAQVRDLAAGCDAVLAPWDGDVHADHEAVGRAARRAGPLTFWYPVWTWHWARPGDSRVPWERAVSVSLRPSVAARKRAAIRCFTSQLETPGCRRRPGTDPGHGGPFHPRSRGPALGGGPMSLDTGYFDQMYAAAPDPWGLSTRWYEARKYALTLALLPEPHYRDAFEPGCSVGVLTGMLAARCGHVLAWDASAAAARAAATRTEALPNVSVGRGAIPGDWPPGQFDLIVFSEVLYYFAGGELDRVLDRGAASLRPGGSLLAVHWRHPVADYPRGGDEVHQVLAARRDLARRVGHTEADFIAEVYQRAGRELLSVAQSEGLA